MSKELRMGPRELEWSPCTAGCGAHSLGGGECIMCSTRGVDPPVRMLMRLPHGETDETKRYSMPDPDELDDSYTAVYRARYYGGPPATPEQMSHVLSLAGGYLDLTAYELGQECCVGKLRDIWRARRARKGQ